METIENLVGPSIERYNKSGAEERQVVLDRNKWRKGIIGHSDPGRTSVTRSNVQKLSFKPMTITAMIMMKLYLKK